MPPTYPQRWARERFDRLKSIVYKGWNMSDKEETPEQFFDLKNIKLAEDDLENMMFIGTSIEFKEFLKAADNCIETIKQSDNIRLIVLETWLFLDYSIRVLLVGAIDGNRINRDEYDLKFYALPRNFRACVELLVRIKQVNDKLPLNPSTNAIKSPIKYLLFLKNEHPQFFAQSSEIEQLYYQKYYPELVAPTTLNHISIKPITFDSKEQKYRNLSTAWLNMTKRIDDSWKKKALRLDNTRNYAAHSFDMMKIAENMGYKGGNTTKHVRNECLDLIEQLLGITPKT